MKGVQPNRKLLLFILLMFFLLLFDSTVSSFSLKLRGVITDDQGQELEGVVLKFYYSELTSAYEIRTNKAGLWQITLPRSGPWYIEFKKSGYERKKIFLQINEVAASVKVVETRLKKIDGLASSSDFLTELGKGDNLLEKGNIDEAIAVYKNLLNSFSEAYALNYFLGNCYFLKKEYDLGADYYRQVLEKDPYFIKALVGLGNCYLNKGEIEEAISWHGQLVIGRVDDPVLLYELGNNYFNNSRSDWAIKYYKRAIELKSDYIDALYYLGLAYLTAGNYRESLNSFRSYLKYDSETERSTQVENFMEFLRTKNL